MSKRPGYTEIVLILSMVSALGPLGVDMYLPSLPTLEGVFQATPGQVQLTLASFFFGFSFGQSIIGPLADRFGRRPPLYVGTLVFILSAVACPFAPNIETLIFFRFLQALGSCSGIVTARAIARDLFTPAETRRVFATLIMVVGVLPMVAPLLGGYLLGWFGWKASFFTMAIVASMALIAFHLRLPETQNKAMRQSLALGHIAKNYRMLLNDRLFLLTALANGIAMAGMFAYIAGSPFVFITLYGVRPDRFGWIFGLNVLGMVVAAQLAGRVFHRTNPRQVLRGATGAQCTAGLLLTTAAATQAGGLFGIMAPLFLYMFCIGMVMPTASAMALANHPEIAGSASALYGTLQFVFAGVATATLSLIGDGSALPMSAVIFACGFVALICGRLMPEPPDAFFAT